MKASRHHSRSALRVFVTWLMLCAQFAATAGVPVARPKSRDTSRPYPCMDRPCGCLSYNECWAGDCCCFTLHQKVAWAARQGIDAPAEARAKTAATPESRGEKQCCAIPSASPKWVSAAFVSACRGTPSDGLPGVALVLPPLKPVVVKVYLPKPTAEGFATSDNSFPSRSDSPPIPPPKRA